MNNSDLKVQLIEKIISSDNEFLKRLNDFINNKDEEKIEILSTLIGLNQTEWSRFIINYNQFIEHIKTERARERLYQLISEEQKMFSNEINSVQREAIEIMLIMGKLLNHGYDRKTITEKINLIKKYDASSIKNRIKEANRIYLFIQENTVAKYMLFQNVIANGSLYRHIMENEHECLTNIEDYLYALLNKTGYKITETKIICPKQKNGKDKQLTKSIIERFNEQNPKFGMPLRLK